LAELKAGQKSINQPFDQVNMRFSIIEILMMVGIAGIYGLIGFMVWDRKTALRSLEEKLDRLAQYVKHDLELQGPEGSKHIRLIHAFRELAKTNQKVAEVMRAYSLL